MTDFTPPPPKLLDQVRDRLRLKHYSMRTETQYVHWIRRFILFHDKRHPIAMGAVEVVIKKARLELKAPTVMTL
jgi:Phage integrase, N-terminal SAM-like domain